MAGLEDKERAVRLVESETTRLAKATQRARERYARYGGQLTAEQRELLMEWLSEDAAKTVAVLEGFPAELGFSFGRTFHDEVQGKVGVEGDG